MNHRVRLRKQTTVSFDHHMSKTVLKLSGKRIMFGHHNSHASSESSMGLAENNILANYVKLTSNTIDCIIMLPNCLDLMCKSSIIIQSTNITAFFHRQMNQ